MTIGTRGQKKKENLGLGLGQGGLVVWGQINSKENVRLWASWASYDCERWGKYAEEKYLLN